MTKRIAVAYLAGIFTVVGLLLYVGGDVVTQLGLRMSAAAQTYDYDATPRATVLEASATIPTKRHR